MLFLLSKLVWILLDPGNLLSILLALGVVQLLVTARRRGLGLIGAVALALLAFIAFPIGEWAIAPLEARFPQPRKLPDHIDGIILLGGAVDTGISQAHGQTSLNDAAERVTTTLALARRYPEARVLFTGGNSEIIQGSYTEAEATAALLVADGLDRSRLLLEDRSRNTIENAIYSKQVAEPKPGEVWLLVTSAAHMPRAVGCFRGVGWTVLPYPVDYRTGVAFTTDRFDLTRSLGLFGNAMREWVGLVAYRILDRTDAFFPAPQTG